MVLAARVVQFENLLGGLDEFYRLHRWFGVAGAVAAIAHWFAEVGVRWMARQRWLPPRQRPPAPPQPTDGFDPFRDLREPATTLGEIAFYLLLALVLVALWKRVPYRHFLKVHKLLSPVFLVLVFHSVILMDRGYWSAPIGPVVAILMGAGTVAATASLFGRIGKSRRAAGSIESLTYYPENTVLDVTVRLATAWPGHRAGQFAFVDFGGAEGAHPFTITSAWKRDGRLSFSIKGLGDYTRALPEQLFEGQAVTVEGPYGRFDFRGEGRQIWIGGGIGITPFIAGLEELAERGRNGPVHLIYSTRAPSDAFIDNIRRLAERAGVPFHLIVSPPEPPLTVDRLAEIVPEWMEADVWFCGPRAFGDALADQLQERGFPPGRFHRELFEMR